MKSYKSISFEFSLNEIKPCLADQRRIRVIANFNTDLTPILEILFLHFPNSSYSKKIGCVITKKSQQMISIFANGKVALTYQADEKEAVENLKKLAETFAKAFEYLKKHGPVDPILVEQRENLTALEVHSLLPRKDCGECGESGCFAFATRLLLGEYKLSDCTLLQKPEFKEKRLKLEKLLTPLNLDTFASDKSELAEFLGL